MIQIGQPDEWNTGNLPKNCLSSPPGPTGGEDTANVGWFFNMSPNRTLGIQRCVKQGIVLCTKIVLRICLGSVATFSWIETDEPVFFFLL